VEDHTDLMFKAHDEQAKDIRQAMEVMTHNVAAGTSMLNATLAVSGDEQQRRHLAQGDFVAMQRLEMDRERHVTEMKTAAPLAMASQRLATTTQVLEQARQSGDPEQIRIAEENFKSAQTDYNAVKYPHLAAGKTTAADGPRRDRRGGSGAVGLAVQAMAAARDVRTVAGAGQHCADGSERGECAADFPGRRT